MTKTGRAIGITLVVLAGIFALLVLAFIAAVPPWLEKSLVPDLVAKAGIHDFSWQIRTVGLSKADFGGIRVGGLGDEAATVASVQLDYSLSGLFDRTLDRVRISGVDLRFEVENGKVEFPGIDIEILSGKGEPRSKTRSDETTPPAWQVGQIELENAVVHCRFEGMPFHLPVDLAIRSMDSNFEKAKIECTLLPFGSPIEITMESYERFARATVVCSVRDFPPENALRLLGRPLAMDLDGVLNLDANAEISLRPFGLVSGHIRIESDDFKAYSRSAIFGASIDQKESMSLSASGGGEKWKISLSGLSVLSPAHLELEKFDAEIHMDGNRTESCFGAATVLRSAGDGSYQFEPPIRRKWAGTLKYDKGEKWRLEMENSPGDAEKEARSGKGWHRVRFDGNDLRVLLPPIQIFCDGDVQGNKIAVDLQSSDIGVDAGLVSASLPSLVAKAEFKQPDTNQPRQAQKNALTFSLKLSDTEMHGGSTEVRLDEIRLSGNLPDLSEEPIRVESELKISGGRAKDSLFDASVEGVHFNLPLVWPPEEKAKRGTLKIDGLVLGGRKIGAVSANVGQTGEGGAFEGVFQCPLLPGLAADFKGFALKGRAGLETRVDFGVKNFRIGPDFDLGKLSPAAKGMLIEGSFSLEGEYQHTGSATKTGLQAKVEDLTFSMQEPSVLVQGVSIDFAVPDLFSLRSLPNQKLSFASAAAGNIQASDGVVFFRMDSPDSFSIEKTTFKWCGGNVDTNAAKIAIPLKQLDLTLYCDRLNLARVLKQLGGVKGEGEGAVNGRIPVTYKNGGFAFHDGFLYSTPGEGGVIRLAETDAIMSGIPKGTPQFAQLDLAREALKNYDYQWAKINIGTEKDALHLNLKLDGKPVGTLPFRYDEQFGGFARVEAGSPGSNFQGIRLDVNFTLPLDEVLKYGMGIKGMLE